MQKLPGAKRTGVVLTEALVHDIHEVFHQFRFPSWNAALRECLRIGIEMKLQKSKPKGK